LMCCRAAGEMGCGLMKRLMECNCVSNELIPDWKNHAVGPLK